MATPALNSQAQSATNEYNLFWQSWPQFEQTNGERRLVGLEVELIGSHKSDINHVDPTCPQCNHVRSVLLGIAERMIKDGVLSGNSFMYNIDSHSNSILCLPALANRSAVSVSIFLYWNHAIGQTFEMDHLNKIKTFLAECGIYQR